MGHEIPNTIGNRAAAAGSSAHAGPSSSNGHSAGAVGLVRLEGDLMYQDDHDWLEYQDEDDDDMADADVLDSSGNGDFTKADAVAAANRHRKGTAAAKRMPIQREEVVRLILQGLRDIGYELVDPSLGQADELMMTAVRRILWRRNRDISSRPNRLPISRRPSLVDAGQRRFSYWTIWASRHHRPAALQRHRRATAVSPRARLRQQQSMATATATAVMQTRPDS